MQPINSSLALQRVHIRGCQVRLMQGRDDFGVPESSRKKPSPESSSPELSRLFHIPCLLESFDCTYKSDSYRSRLAAELPLINILGQHRLTWPTFGARGSKHLMSMTYRSGFAPVSFIYNIRPQGRSLEVCSLGPELIRCPQPPTRTMYFQLRLLDRIANRHDMR